jgi:hypothetical protein
MAKQAAASRGVAVAGVTAVGMAIHPEGDEVHTVLLSTLKGGDWPILAILNGQGEV